MKIISFIGQYFQSVYAELGKVIWPSRKQAITNTVLVIVAVVLTIILFGTIDFGLSSLLGYLLQK